MSLSGTFGMVATCLQLVTEPTSMCGSYEYNANLEKYSRNHMHMFAFGMRTLNGLRIVQ